MNDSKPNPKNIFIDLRESQNANRFKGNTEKSLLQRTALERVKHIIKELSGKIKQAKNDPTSMDDLTYPRSHDIITINGERGSGKSTFILNILELISSPKWRDENKIECKIKTLGIIDPTLIEGYEHIFLAVIGRIKEAVDRHWECGRAGMYAETIDALHLQWTASLDKLAQGLRGLGKDKDWDGASWSDPQFIMAEGLENSIQSVKLERHFHHFVEVSLRFIEEDAFIIALDDVDTKVDTGWPVLEILRKYLTTPRLIVILSGDIELYTQLISSKQCEQIEVKPEKIIEKQKEYAVQRDLVNDLTEQYMMKIMRPDYRIEMQTVAQIAQQVDREGGEIMVQWQGHEKGVNLNDVLKEFCAKIYGFKSKQKDYLAQVLTEVPARTFIQLLNTATKLPATPDHPTEDQKESYKKDHLEAVAGLGHVFQNALARAGLSSKLVNEVDAQHITLGRLACALEKKNLLRQGVHLFPNLEKTWQRQLMMVLGAVYSRALFKRLGMPFEYLVYMCFPAYLQGVLDDKDFKRYLLISQLGMEFEAINTVKRGLRFILEEVKVTDAKKPDANNTNIHINAKFCLGKTVVFPWFTSHHNTNVPNASSNHDANSTIDTEYCLVRAVDDFQSPTSWLRYLLNMASVFAETNGVTHRYISFYALLGAIATMAGSVKDKNAENAADEIMRQYGSEDNPRFGEGHTPPARQGNKSDQGEAKPQNEFNKLFAKWSWVGPDLPVPLLALSESWNRFSSATKQLKQKHNGATANPGEYLQDCIILYLGHLLEYEMDIMNIKSTTIHDGNDIIEKRFANNISSYKKVIEEEKCMIFDYVFSCPIWMYFFDIDNEYKSGGSEQRKEIIDYYKVKVNAIDKVNAIKVENTDEQTSDNITKCTVKPNLFVFLNEGSQSHSNPVG